MNKKAEVIWHIVWVIMGLMVLILVITLFIKFDFFGKLVKFIPGSEYKVDEDLQLSPPDDSIVNLSPPDDSIVNDCEIIGSIKEGGFIQFKGKPTSNIKIGNPGSDGDRPLDLFIEDSFFYVDDHLPIGKYIHNGGFIIGRAFFNSNSNLNLDSETYREKRFLFKNVVPEDLVLLDGAYLGHSNQICSAGGTHPGIIGRFEGYISVDYYLSHHSSEKRIYLKGDQVRILDENNQLISFFQENGALTNPGGHERFFVVIDKGGYLQIKLIYPRLFIKGSYDVFRIYPDGSFWLIYNLRTDFNKKGIFVNFNNITLKNYPDKFRSDYYESNLKFDYSKLKSEISKK